MPPWSKKPPLEPDAELGIFARRQVVHSYCVAILWLILHHAATRATVWLKDGFTAKNYLLTLRNLKTSRLGTSSLRTPAACP